MDQAIWVTPFVYSDTAWLWGMLCSWRVRKRVSWSQTERQIVTCCLVYCRPRVGFLQTGSICLSELLRHPPQPVQPGQIHKAGLLGGWASRGRGGHFNVHVIVINTSPICLYLSHLRSSWKPTAMPALEPFLRKQFQCTTISLRRTTAGECLSQLFLG